jgi:hypothetical protein
MAIEPSTRGPDAPTIARIFYYNSTNDVPERLQVSDGMAGDLTDGQSLSLRATASYPDNPSDPSDMSVHLEAKPPDASKDARVADVFSAPSASAVGTRVSLAARRPRKCERPSGSWARRATETGPTPQFRRWTPNRRFRSTKT